MVATKLIMKHTFIDLFGAPGGMSRGFQLAGFRPLGMLDIFADGVETYRKNFPQVPEQNVVLGDASNLGIVKRFEKTTGLRPGDIDVIVGGPPCQGFSTVGRVMIAQLVKEGGRTGRSKNPRFIDDPRNNLYKSFVKFVRHYRPKAVVMENVPGMMSYKNGGVADQIKRDLVASGYPNTDFQILNAVNFGVPQKRKRIIFIGTRKDTAIQWPEMTHMQLKDDQARLDTQVPVTVRDAFDDLPTLELPERGSKAKDEVVAYAKRAISEYQEFVRDGSTELHNHITRWHRDNDITIFNFMEEGMRWKDLPDIYRKMIGYSDSSFNDKWKRLVLDEPSWTVVSHLSKDGYMYIHPTESRTISVREAARLQSFPDSFVFYGSRGSQFKQVGNAVPPLLAMAIANSVKKMLK